MAAVRWKRPCRSPNLAHFRGVSGLWVLVCRVTPHLSLPLRAKNLSPGIPSHPSTANLARSCRSALSNGELRLLTSSRLNQCERDGNFIPFYMQARRHLELGVSAKSRCVHYLLAVRQYRVSEKCNKTGLLCFLAPSNIFLLFILILGKKH